MVNTGSHKVQCYVTMLNYDLYSSSPSCVVSVMKSVDDFGGQGKRCYLGNNRAGAPNYQSDQFLFTESIEKREASCPSHQIYNIWTVKSLMCKNS